MNFPVKSKATLYEHFSPQKVIQWWNFSRKKSSVSPSAIRCPACLPQPRRSTALPHRGGPLSVRDVTRACERRIARASVLFLGVIENTLSIVFFERQGSAEGKCNLLQSIQIQKISENFVSADTSQGCIGESLRETFHTGREKVVNPDSASKGCYFMHLRVGWCWPSHRSLPHKKMDNFLTNAVLFLAMWQAPTSWSKQDLV